MKLPEYCSLQNVENKEYRCSSAGSLEKTYSAPRCLMKLIPYDVDTYYIMCLGNNEFFTDSITHMTAYPTSRGHRWIIKANGAGYTIQNALNGEYMTRHATKLSGQVKGDAQRWYIVDRAVPVVDYRNSYYGTLQTNENYQYRDYRPGKLSYNPEIPECLFKMVNVAPSVYALQNQYNYEFYQSDIKHLSKGLYDANQEWTIAKWGNSGKLSTLQNRADGQYMYPSGTKGDNTWIIKRFDCEKTRSWMEDNSRYIANKPLSKICMPGSHDAGTYIPTYVSNLASERITKTQLFDIQFQLMQGVRAFDLRPVYFKNDFYTAHYSNEFGGYQGAIGVQLKAALEQVSAFISLHRRELVILNFSHFLNWDERDSNPELTTALQQKLFQLVKDALKGCLICDNGENMLNTYPLAGLYSYGNVICLFQDGVTIGKDDPKSGIWESSALPMKGGYANSNNLKEMKADQLEKLKVNRHDNHSPFLFELCWQLTLSKGQNLPTASTSILDLAREANPALYPSVKSWVENKLINQDTYPNIINTDACYEDVTRAVEVCMMVNKIIV